MKRSPSVPPSASGIQTVSVYVPTKQELAYLAAVRDLAEKDVIPRDVAATAECIQLCKVTGLHLTASDAVRKILDQLAEEFDVDTKF